MYKCNTRTLKSIITVLLQAGLVPFVQSSPGMGKSAIIKEVAKDFNLKLIDHRVSTSDPTDFSGLPSFENGFAKMSPFEEIFPLTTTKLPKGKDGFLLFLDEFNSASKSTQAAAYKTVLDRMVGQHHLHGCCAIIMAGNLATDRAIVNSLSTAMQSRVVHLELELDFDIWFEDVAVVQNYHPTIKAFLLANKSRLMDFRPDHSEKTFACPRTWEFMDKQVKVTNGPQDCMIPAYVGTITSGVATEYVQFSKIFDSVIKIADVLENPLEVAVPQDNASKWATLCSMMEWATKDNFSRLSLYANRYPADMKIFFYRSVLNKLPDIRREPAFLQACASIANLL